MGKFEKLLAKARANPSGLRFSELSKLCELAGMTHRGTSGSHKVYVHPSGERPIPIQQSKDGSAKDYQVRQVLQLIEDLGLEGEE